MPSILIVAASRAGRAQFKRDSLLASSLRRLAFDRRIESAITYKNREGLASVFNRQIVKENRTKILVFTHDDVRFDDYWLRRRLEEGLERFDIIGVAGNRRRVPRHLSWAFDARRKWDTEVNLSGAVSHLIGGRETVSYYGKSGRRCGLLDGLMIAAKASTLLEHDVRFDEQFSFFYYDLDFCRTAELRGLTLGTWPIALTHASGGDFTSPEWRRRLKLYRRKWGD